MNKIIYDYHIHSDYSPDSTSHLEDVVKTAIKNNLKEIAITNHINPCMTTGVLYDAGFKEHLEEIEKIQNIYNNKITILKGAEITLITDNEKEYDNFLKKYKDLDFIIGSSHTLLKEDLYSSFDYTKYNKKNAYELYLTEVLQCIPKYNFSVYGHLDFISRYSGYEDPFMLYKDFSNLYDEIFKTLIKYNKGLEINTSGIRYGIDSLYPHKDILKRYRELGGEIITIGSDAHKLKDISCDFNIAYDYLKECGFDNITTFKKMKPSQIKF